jgi:hypothetical protein
VTFRIGARRGGPGDFAGRLARTEHLLTAPGHGGGAEGPLSLLAAILRFEAAQAAMPAVVAAAGRAAAGAELRKAANRFPLLDLAATVTPVAVAVPVAFAVLTGGRSRGVAGPAGAAHSLPDLLLAAGAALAEAPEAERAMLVEEWLEDPVGPEPVLGFWVRVAAGPVLEVGRAAVAGPGRDEWTGAACPACGGPPQASVIAEESGEFMGGSPRSLVCARCAGWWTFPRATCAWCGEADPRRLGTFLPDDRRTVRIDGCKTCGRYVKTFDLRAPGGAELVPLVDDIATVSLDLWARDQGLTRPLVSFAGV